MKKLIYISCLLLTTPGICQLSAEKTAISKIKTEGFQHSQAYSLLTELTDEVGPRLTGSRQYLQAAIWAKNKLEEWKLKNVHFESYCPDCMGWEVRSFDVEMTKPSYLKVHAYPCAWTVGSNGTQDGAVVYVPETDLSELQQYSGKLSGKVVLFGKSPEQDMHFEPLTSRYTSDQLTGTSKSIEPNPDDPLGISLHGMPFEQFLRMFKERKDKNNEVYEFFRKEGALAIMKTSRPTFPGIVHADAPIMSKKMIQNLFRYLPSHRSIFPGWCDCWIVGLR